jgi:hypothetical protein
MATVLALKQGKEVDHPRRHLFAWFLSIFIPRIGGTGGIIGIDIGTDENGNTKWIVLLPSYDNDNLIWSCYGENIENRYLPTDCRSQE